MNEPEIRKVGSYGAQVVELHTGTSELYVGRRKVGTLGATLHQCGHLLKLQVKTEIEEQIVAAALAKDRIRLSKYADVIEIENRGRFLNAMTHAIAREKPAGKSDEDHEIRTELDCLLDDARAYCTNGHNGRH